MNPQEATYPLFTKRPLVLVKGCGHGGKGGWRHGRGRARLLAVLGIKSLREDEFGGVQDCQFLGFHERSCGAIINGFAVSLVLALNVWFVTQAAPWSTPGTFNLSSLGLML